jgi:hypothetical protein
METRYVIVIINFCSPLTHVFCMLGSCHLGNIIEYDTVSNLSWTVDVRTHAIAQVVDKILSEPWAAAEALGREVPPLKRQDDCVVSFRVPRRNVELLAHSRCCRIASNGTLETTAYYRPPVFIRPVHSRVFQKHHSSAVGNNNSFKKMFGDEND